VLHYIQDVTVPHHCEIGGNYPDLCLGYYNLTYYHVAMESGSSQTAYEQTYINNTFASNGANFTKNTIDWRANLIIDPKFISTFFPGALNARNILQNNNGLDNIVLGIRDYVAFTNFPAAPKGNFMDFVDGWANYDEDKILSDKGLASVETWVRVKCYSGYVDPYYKRCRFSCNVGVNDDQEYVANNLIPIAVKASALVIAKFFHEVKGTSISSLSSIPKDAIFYHR
jgi:hypothetical protein